MSRRTTKVKAYQTRRSMERGINRMLARGYHVHSQSGEFTRSPFTLRWNRRKVVVTFELIRVQPVAAPPPTPPEMLLRTKTAAIAGEIVDWADNWRVEGEMREELDNILRQFAGVEAPSEAAG